MTSLHIAVALGGNKLTRALLEELEHDKAELLRLINLDVEGYGTPLDAACRYERVEAIRLLVAHGADVVRKLHESVVKGSLAEVSLLARLGADLDAEISIDGMKARPITYTLPPGDGSLEMLELLINCGADVNYITATGNTPLFAAIAYQSLPKLKLLIGAGADVNWGQGTPKAPLVVATRTGNLDLVLHLLRAGANADSRDGPGGSGDTALYLAASLGHEAIVGALITGGATIDASDGSGITPLCAATGLGHDGAARLLTAAGADQAVLERLLVHRDPQDGKLYLLLRLDYGEEASPEINYSSPPYQAEPARSQEGVGRSQATAFAARHRK